MTPLTAPTPLPERSLDQRRQALRVANDIRIRRGHLKRDITAGRVCASDILRDPPSWVTGMRVIVLICAIPNVGLVKARRTLFRARVSESKTVGGITQRQRDELVALLEARANDRRRTQVAA